MGDFTLTVSSFRLPNLERIAKELSDPSHPTWVKAGILGGATAEDGTSVAEYAAYNEFGTSEIPRRPFIRSTMDENAEKYKSLLQGALHGLASAGSAEPIRMALTAVGREMEVDIKQKIMSNMDPPNAPAYAAWKEGRRKVTKNGKVLKRPRKRQKGYVGTLFLTGTMLKSVAYELMNGDQESIA